MNTEFIGIDVGQALQVFHTLHLVLHLYLSQPSEGSLFEVASTILRTAIVENKDDIALLCHIRFPRTTGPVPASLHVMSVRTTIDINYGWIFLVGVEVVRLHHAIVEVGHAICSLDTATFEDRLFVVLPRVGSREQTRGSGSRTARHTEHADVAWLGGGRVAVEHVTA